MHRSSAFADAGRASGVEPAPAVNPLEARIDEALLTSVRGVGAVEAAARRLEQIARFGSAGIDQRLPSERRLLESFGVSRGTLREAVQTLVARDLGVVRRGRAGGVFATIARAEPSVAAALDAAVRGGDVLDALVVREEIEAATARRAAERGGASGLAELLLATSEAAASDYRRADARLHLGIAVRSGSRRLFEMVLDLQTELDGVIAIVPALRMSAKRSQRQHERIVAAIAAGDGPLAERTMREHLRATSRLVRAALAGAAREAAGP